MKAFVLAFMALVLLGCGKDPDISKSLLIDVRIKEAKLNSTSPAYISGCLHCGDKWTWKEDHSTMYEVDTGMFPLCEECFTKLTYPYTLWYHLKLFEEWGQVPTDEQIETLSWNISDGKNDNMWAVSWIKEKLYNNGKLKSIYSIEP